MTESRLDNFTHLQVHSHYTLLGGTAAIPDLTARAVEQGMNALALTDTAVLYGAVQFTQACQQSGIQPIIGMTVPLAAEGFVADTAVPGQIVLLAMNPAGYRTLNRISSAIQTDPAQNYRQRGIPWELLRQNRDGLIALDGGRRGWLARLLRRGDEKTAVKYAARLAGLFGENSYLSLEIHRGGAEGAEEISGEKSSAPSAPLRLNETIIAIGRRFGLAAAAVQPVYCLEAADVPKLRLLAAIDRNCRLEEVPDTALPDEGDTAVALHWQSPDQIAAKFSQFPDAVARVGEIVARCGEVLPDGRPIWPALDLPQKQTPAQALAEQAEKGLAARYGNAPDPAIRQRLAHELDLINQFGFAPLFLLTADITRFARASGVPVNTRGSVANSLVAYCVGITTVDPIEHDLLFERFLNPARASLPDIDLDFCSRRRDEVLRYVRQKYGAERVALVSAMSTMRLKSAARETAKAYGLGEAAIKRLAALIPRRWHPDPRRRQTFELEEALAQLDEAREREALRAAVGIAGLPHHLTVHPGGIVVTPGPLTDAAPLQMTPKGFTVTQYDHRDVEAIGLPKIDLLGIRALTVLADTADLIRQQHDPDFDLEAILPDDAATAVILQSGQTIGVFQCESTGAQRTLRQLRAKNVADLAIANAFFKPGPALGGMAQAFVRRYRGEESVTFLHPLLEPILGRTKGVLIFQEQVLRIATGIAGLNWTEANAIRRGMSKFQKGDLL
ncbi:MAG TPA: DNA polymerase III subunit alpha, partial [Anaerolineae bacterium]|nr:DNA polymerase III subunit alpha [Anaerolineae bacterium]